MSSSEILLPPNSEPVVWSEFRLSNQRAFSLDRGRPVFHLRVPSDSHVVVNQTMIEAVIWIYYHNLLISCCADVVLQQLCTALLLL